MKIVLSKLKYLIIIFIDIMIIFTTKEMYLLKIPKNLSKKTKKESIHIELFDLNIVKISNNLCSSEIIIGKLIYLSHIFDIYYIDIFPIALDEKFLFMLIIKENDSGKYFSIFEMNNDDLMKCPKYNFDKFIFFGKLKEIVFFNINYIDSGIACLIERFHTPYVINIIYQIVEKSIF